MNCHVPASTIANFQLFFSSDLHPLCPSYPSYFTTNPRQHCFLLNISECSSINTILFRPNHNTVVTFPSPKKKKFQHFLNTVKYSVNVYISLIVLSTMFLNWFEYEFLPSLHLPLSSPFPSIHLSLFIKFCGRSQMTVL